MSRRPAQHATPDPIPQAGGRLLNVKEAATFLGTDPRWIRRRVDRRLLPYRKLCGRIFFLRSELEDFITSLPGISVEQARENLALRNGDVVPR